MAKYDRRTSWLGLVMSLAWLVVPSSAWARQDDDAAKSDRKMQERRLAVGLEAAQRSLVALEQRIAEHEATLEAVERQWAALADAQDEANQAEPNPFRGLASDQLTAIRAELANRIVTSELSVAELNARQEALRMQFKELSADPPALSPESAEVIEMQKQIVQLTEQRLEQTRQMFEATAISQTEVDVCALNVLREKKELASLVHEATAPHVDAAQDLKHQIDELAVRLREVSEVRRVAEQLNNQIVAAVRQAHEQRSLEEQRILLHSELDRLRDERDMRRDQLMNYQIELEELSGQSAPDK